MGGSDERGGHDVDQRIAALERTVSRQRWLGVAWIGALTLGLTSCVAMVIQTPTEWILSKPAGVRTMLDAADSAVRAYHAIADTSIVDLQGDDTSRRVGQLVTHARDAWRSAESYDLGWGPSAMLSNQNGKVWSDASAFREDLYPWCELSGLGYALRARGGFACVELESSRGKPVGVFRSDGSVEWCEPFRSIVAGDRIDSIEGLIARIKR